MDDFHDYAPVPVAYCKDLNKGTMYSDFFNFHYGKHKILLLTLTCTWDVNMGSGGQGSENGPSPPNPTSTPQIIWGIFQSIHCSSSFTPVFIIDLTSSQYALATRINYQIVKIPSQLLSQIL